MKPGRGFITTGVILIFLGLAFIIPPLATAQDLIDRLDDEFNLDDLYVIQHDDATLRLDITLGVIMLMSGINLLGIGKIIRLISRKQ